LGGYAHQAKAKEHNKVKTSGGSKRAVLFLWTSSWLSDVWKTRNKLGVIRLGPINRKSCHNGVPTTGLLDQRVPVYGPTHPEKLPVGARKTAFGTSGEKEQFAKPL
jgi:hypothetical protein